MRADGVKSGELREALQVISVVIVVCALVRRAALRELCNRSGVSLAGSKQGGKEGARESEREGRENSASEHGCSAVCV